MDPVAAVLVLEPLRLLLQNELRGRPLPLLLQGLSAKRTSHRLLKNLVPTINRLFHLPVQPVLLLIQPLLVPVIPVPQQQGSPVVDLSGIITPLPPLLKMTQSMELQRQIPVLLLLLLLLRFIRNPALIFRKEPPIPPPPLHRIVLLRVPTRPFSDLHENRRQTRSNCKEPWMQHQTKQLHHNFTLRMHNPPFSFHSPNKNQNRTTMT